MRTHRISIPLLLLQACATGPRPCSHDGEAAWLSARTADDAAALPPRPGLVDPLPGPPGWRPASAAPARVAVTVHNPTRLPRRVTLMCGAGELRRTEVLVAPRLELVLDFLVPRRAEAVRLSCEIVRDLAEEPSP